MDLKTARFRGTKNQTLSETELTPQICNKQEKSFDPNKLLTFQELPSWLQDNSFILKLTIIENYCFGPPSLKTDAFRSVFVAGTNTMTDANVVELYRCAVLTRIE